MLQSTETRWMLSPTETQFVGNWFNGYGEKFSNDNNFPRQDYYLKTNTKNLGVKIREPKKDSEGNIIAKLELKVLLEDQGKQNFTYKNTGFVNSWVKYSFDLDKKTNPLELLQDKLSLELRNEWILIEKDRLLVKFDALQKKIVSKQEIINEGAGIELTKFTYQKNVYFSLGIEAFSNKQNSNTVFNETIDFLFKETKIEGLLEINSKTYPEILLDL